MNGNFASKEELVDYVNTVFDLEIQLNILENTLDGIKEYTEGLMVEEDIPEPVLYEEEVPTAVDAIGYFVACLIVAFFIDTVFQTIPVFTAIGAIIGLIAFFIKLMSIPRIKKNNEMYIVQYEKEIEEYEAACQREEQRLDLEEQELEIYDQQYELLATTFNDTLELLEKLYGMGIIYGKYKSDLVAIGMFCEYLESERCDSLGGPNGAYNIYENEIRQDIIISKLDDIIQYLDDIKETQYKLYCEVQNMNCKIDELLQAVHSVAQNQDRIIKNQDKQIESSRAIEYNANVLRRNSEIAMIYQLH